MRAVEFMRKMLDVFDAEEQAQTQQPVVINIVNGAAAGAEPSEQNDIEFNDPAQRIGANGQPIMTPPLQQP